MLDLRPQHLCLGWQVAGKYFFKSLQGAGGEVWALPKALIGLSG